MPYAVLVVALLVTLLILISSSWSRVRAEEPKSPPAAAAPATPAAPAPEPAKHLLSRAELAKMLGELARKPAPAETTRVCAMCYEVGDPPNRVEYVCPVCGEKTLYATGAGPDVNRRVKAELLQWVIPETSACRRLVKEIESVKMTLDEQDFCRRCRPNVKKLWLNLLVWYPDRKRPHRTANITREDLELLRDFLAQTEGRTRADPEAQVSLRDRLWRIEQLLGVKAAEAEPEQEQASPDASRAAD